MIGAAVLLPLLWMQHKKQPLNLPWRSGMLTMLVGITNSALPFALFAWAVLHIPTGIASILNASTPLFGALVAYAWFSESITRKRWLGLSIGFTGVALLIWHTPHTTTSANASTTTSWLATGACLGAALLYAVSSNLTRRYLSATPALTTATGSLVGASLALGIPTIAQWPSTPPPLSAWACIAALGVLCTGIAYLLFFRLIQKAGPSTTLTVTFLVPVFALLYGGIFLHESPTATTLLGALLALCGTLIATHHSIDKAPQKDRNLSKP